MSEFADSTFRPFGHMVSANFFRNKAEAIWSDPGPIQTHFGDLMAFQIMFTGTLPGWWPQDAELPAVQLVVHLPGGRKQLQRATCVSGVFMNHC